MEELTRNFSRLELEKNRDIPTKKPNIEQIIKIQKWFRGCNLRLKQLPIIMYKIRDYLKLQAFNFSNKNDDGRINS